MTQISSRPRTVLCLATLVCLLAWAVLGPGGGEAWQTLGDGRRASPAGWRYVSSIGPLPGTWDSGIAIQSLHPASQQTVVEFYNAQGARVEGATVFLTLPAYSSETVWLPSINALPAGSYSAVISSEHPIAYVNMVINPASRMGNAYANSAPAYRMELPLVYRWMGTGLSWYTRITVQNAGNSPTRPSLRMHSADSDVSVMSYLSPDSIPPDASRTFDLTAQEFALLGNSFTGGVSITADQPLVVLGAHYRDDAYKMLAFSPGIDLASAGTSTLAPLLFRNYGGSQGPWRSLLQVKNTSSFPAQVRVTYRPAKGAATPAGSPWRTGDSSAAGWAEYTIPANAVLGVDPQAAPRVQTPSGLMVDLPDDFVGSALVESTNGALVVGIVTALNAGRGSMAGAYNMYGPAQTAAKVATPLLYKGFNNGAGDWASRIHLQNASTNQEARVAITLRSAAAAGLSSGPWRALDESSSAMGEITIPPAGSISLPLSDLKVLSAAGATGSLPDNFLGSATIESANGVRVAATVLTTNYELGLGVVYNGFGY